MISCKWVGDMDRCEHDAAEGTHLIKAGFDFYEVTLGYTLVPCKVCKTGEFCDACISACGHVMEQKVS